MIKKHITLAYIFIIIFIFPPALSIAATKPQKKIIRQNTIDYRKEIKNVRKFIYHKNYYQALGYLKALLKYVAPADRETKYKLFILTAQSYVNVKMYDRAIKHFKLAIPINKDPREAFSGLIKVSFMKKKFIDVIDYYSGYHKANDSNLGFEAYYLLMLANYKSGNYKATLKLSNFIMDGAGEKFKHYINYIKAQSLLKLDPKNTKEAQKLLKNIINDKYANKDFKEKVNLTFANLLFEEGKYKKALEQYLNVKRTPFNDQAMYGEIWCYIKLKDYAKALKVADKFLLSFRESLSYEDVIMLKGQIFAIYEKYKPAVEAFELAKNDFDYSISFMQASMLSEDYIKRLSSLFEVVDYASYRYSSDFRYLKFRSNLLKRYNEKRLLKSLANEDYIYSDLSSLVSVRDIMESLNGTKINFRSLESKYEFNIQHFKMMIGIITDEIEKLKDIKLTHIETELKKNIDKVDLNSFATANDKFLLKITDDSLFDVEKVLQYIDTIKNLFAKKSKKNRFFKNLQKVMLESPAFSLEDKKDLDGTQNFNNDEIKLFKNISNLKSKMYSLNNQFSLILWDVSSKMVLGKKEKDGYWTNSHHLVKLEIDKMYNIITDLQAKTFNQKILVKKSIKEKVAARRKILINKLLEVNNYILDLEIVCTQLIGHIDSLVEELKPIDQLIKKTQDTIKYLEKTNLIVLTKAKKSFRKTLSKGIENKFKEYKILIEEANFEIADNLFRAATGSR